MKVHRDHVAPSVTLDQLVSFLQEMLKGNPAAYGQALNFLTRPIDIPDEYPAGNAPGGANNTDGCMMAVNRAAIFNDADDFALSENAWLHAVNWMRAYKVQGGRRDAGHRFLDGILSMVLRDQFVSVRDEALDVLIQHGHGFARVNLDRYRKADWGGVRYVTRELANVMLAGWALENLRQDPIGSRRCYDTVRDSLEWFLAREWKRPLDTFRGVVSGWGCSDDGVPFLGDQIDREEVYHSNIGSPCHIPYQTFSTAYRAIGTVHTFRPSYWDPTRVQEIELALMSIERGFRVAYADRENPAVRGTGPTQPQAICWDMRGGEGVKVAQPAALGLPTGSMLYPYWHFGLKPTGEPDWRFVSRALEALVVQSANYWQGMLPLMLFDVQLLALVERWAAGSEPPAPPQDPPIEPSRLREAYRLLRKGGYREEANLLKGHAQASENYLKDIGQKE